MQLFKNSKKKGVMIRGKKLAAGYEWITVKPGDTIRLPEVQGEAYGLDRVEEEEGKPGEEKCEDKKLKKENSKKDRLEKKQMRKKAAKEKDKAESYKSELQALKGIGEKTAEDLLEMFPSRKELVEAVRKKQKISVRDDVEEILRAHFSR